MATIERGNDEINVYADDLIETPGGEITKGDDGQTGPDELSETPGEIKEALAGMVTKGSADGQNVIVNGVSHRYERRLMTLGGDMKDSVAIESFKMDDIVSHIETDRN